MRTTASGLSLNRQGDRSITAQLGRLQLTVDEAQALDRHES